MLTKTGSCWVAVLLISSVAWSVQEITPFHEGDHTLTLGGGGNGDKDFDNSTLSINVGYSQFITNVTAVASGRNSTWQTQATIRPGMVRPVLP